MMQFEVNGEYLELPANFSLQFKKTNVLFAFDNMECERSTSFDVPATPVNDRIFTLARQVQGTGAGMRVRYAAQLQGSGVTKDGYLYVQSANNRTYKAVFVTGELIGLQAIRAAGKIGDILGDTGELATYGADNPYSPMRTYFDVVRYGQTYGGNRYVPSVKLDEMINRAVAALGIQAQQVSGAIRILLQEPKAPSGTFEYDMLSADSWATQFNTSNVLNTLTPRNNNTLAAFLQTTTHKIRYQADNVPHYMYGRIRQFYSSTNELELVFPSDLSADWFLMSFPVDCAELPTNDPEIYKPGGYTYGYTLGVFLGDYSFDNNQQSGQRVTTGEPLGGRTVVIPQGVPFVLMNANSMFEYYVGGSKGWYDPYSQNTLSFDIGERDAVFGNKIGLYNNYPSVTLLDLCKTYAALYGRVLYYDEANGLTFDNLAISGWGSVDISDKVLEFGDVTRTFGDYAQRNTISFDGDDTQYAGDKLTRVYNIANVNISEEKELQRIPFSEGSVNQPSPRLYIRNNAENPTPSAYVLGSFSVTGSPATAILNRVNLPANTGLQALCTASTMTQIKARLTLLEYEQITPKTRIYCNGSFYVWTEAQWSKGVATFKLSKT